MYARQAGELPDVFSCFDLLNFPNPNMNLNSDALVKDIHVLNFIFDDEDKILINPPFNYYKYMGSKTTPPCEESVVWFVLSEPRLVGPTVLAMFRDVLTVPG